MRSTRQLEVSPAILREGLSGKKERRPRKRRAPPRRWRSEFFDAVIAHRKFGINDIVDQRRGGESGRFELLNRPVSPGSIIGHEIEQDIRVDERQTSPRVSAMIASVVSPSPAYPRSF